MPWPDNQGGSQGDGAPQPLVSSESGTLPFSMFASSSASHRKAKDLLEHFLDGGP